MDGTRILHASPHPKTMNLVPAGAHSSFMLGVRQRVRRMVRAGAEHGGSLQRERSRSSTDDGGVGRTSQQGGGGALALLGPQQRLPSFSSLRPLSPAPGGGGGRSARESGLSDNGGGISSELHGRDAQTSSGDDTIMQPLSRMHSYSSMRPSGGEAVLGSLPIAVSVAGGVGGNFASPPTTGGGALGTRQLSFSSGSRGMASELAVLAGLRQASQASLGRGSLISAAAGDKQPAVLPGLRVLSTTNEGSFVAANSLMSSQSLTQKCSTPCPPRRQNTDVDLGRLSGARDP